MLVDAPGSVKLKHRSFSSATAGADRFLRRSERTSTVVAYGFCRESAVTQEYTDR